MQKFTYKGVKQKSKEEINEDDDKKEQPKIVKDVEMMNVSNDN